MDAEVPDHNDRCFLMMAVCHACGMDERLIDEMIATDGWWREFVPEGRRSEGRYKPQSAQP